MSNKCQKMSEGFGGSRQNVKQISDLISHATQMSKKCLVWVAWRVTCQLNVGLYLAACGPTLKCRHCVWVGFPLDPLPHPTLDPTAGHTILLASWGANIILLVNSLLFLLPFGLAGATSKAFNLMSPNCNTRQLRTRRTDSHWPIFVQFPKTLF